MPVVEVRSVEFSVVPGDIMVFEADVVALKHAQAFLGADKAVAQRLEHAGIMPNQLQAAPGAHRLVETRGGIRAPRVLYVGMPPISQIDYSHIKNFAQATLGILQKEAPGARHVAMTLHGPGFWLDEAESFLAEFAGCLVALDAEAVPDALERISIVERDANRVERLRRLLEQDLANAEYAIRLRSGAAYRLSVRRMRMGHAGAVIETTPPTMKLPGAPSESKPHVFVAMPFSKDMDDVFYYGIQAPVRAAGFTCERVDQEAFTGDILERVKQKIETAAIVIAELTGANPNVYLEVGYAWGTGRPTILLVGDESELRFDVRGHRCLTYQRIRDLEEALAKEIAGLQAQGIIQAA